MKTIVFPDTALFNSRSQLKELIEAAPSPEGYAVGEVRSAIRVLEKLDDIGESGPAIELEDAEYAFVIGRVGKARWNVAHPDIVKFMDAISNPS